mmetsp:Transcript_2498/g.2995  ORF Transcript_2498/g.2995 Transcript_2498/m.2995 type:complete len:273 (+) Transcript_2498:36-854(+)
MRNDQNATSIVDPKDLKYQVDPKHKPNKESLWKYPKEKDRWYHANDALRGEVDGFQNAISQVVARMKDDEKQCFKEKDWIVMSIQKWFDGHEKHASDHCQQVDDQLKPFCSTRFHWPEKEEDTSQNHNALKEQRTKISILVKNLPNTVDGFEELEKVWSTYQSILFNHLRTEEETYLPLYRAYFTSEEVGQLCRKIAEAGPLEAQGAMIYYMGEDKFRNDYMKQLGIPFFVWNLAFKKQLAYYKQEMESHIIALSTGVEPPGRKKTKRSGWF